MYTPAFYHKFLYDMLLEQRQQGGAVPHVVPDILGQIRKITGQVGGDLQNGSSAWGDAATVIPWTLYLFYGDKTMLSEHYENMKEWVNYIRNQEVEHCGGKYLWQHGFHFADWLALDNPDPKTSFGGTDPYYVASSYYYYSAALTAKAARVLGRYEDAAYYEDLAAHICEAMRKEYFSPEGRLLLDTQTAYVLALYFGFAPEGARESLTKELKRKLDERDIHLDTGFVGTAYLCLTLSGAGLSDYAYALLMNEDYPSWLYEVNMGATTVWERWNSVLADGRISDTGMNSMNHYAYGAVAEWIYRKVCGLNPVWENPGFKRTRIAPQVDRRLDWVKMTYDSAAGQYGLSWKREGKRVDFALQVPFDSQAEFVFPEGCTGYTLDGEALQGGSVVLTAGKHALSCDNELL